MNLAVTVDGSAATDRALDHALSMLEPLGATVAIVHAVEPQAPVEGGEEPVAGVARTGDRIIAESLEGAEPRAERVLNAIAERVADAGIDATTEFPYGDPVEAIPTYADEADADGIFVGHRGLSRRYEELVGSVAKELVERASCPVIVVRWMWRLDGRNGGGQPLRTALVLSLVTSESFEVTNVHGNRSTSGLRAQHVACVSVAAAVSNAAVEGGEVGSLTLRFSPDRVRTDPVEVAVGTAGSATLVCETVLPAAVALDDPLSLTVTGGTDVRWSPPADYHRHVKRPLCSRFDVEFGVSVPRRGFYPANGGRLSLRIEPAGSTPLALGRRADPDELQVYSVESGPLTTATVAEWQVEDVRDALAEADVNLPVRVAISSVESDSPGSVVVAVARGEDGECVGDGSESVVAGFDAYGERNTPAKAVGLRAVASFLDWPGGDAPMNRYTADQLLVWAAFAGGRLRIPAVTDHVRTNLNVTRAFGYDVALLVGDGGDGAVVESGGGR